MDPKEDKYGRKEFAKKIAEKIMFNYDHNSSLAIGINGAWGSGKTSFVNMIKHELKKKENIKQRIIIDFHPWKSINPSQIIKDFFEGFTNEIEKFNPKLSSKIITYSKTLTKLEDNILNKTVDVLSDLVSGNETKHDLYEEINQELECTQKQIIVFIDDLDRLDKIEVIEVIRLIRNTASFHHVTFVVSYDRQYVINAIKILNDLYPNLYLEKIFQFEFILPAYEKDILKQMFVEKIKDLISQEHLNDLNDFIYPVKGMHRVDKINFFEEFIKTKRDVIRLANNLLFEYQFINEEFNISELATIDLLKIKFPDIYDMVYEKKDKFFETIAGAMGLDFYLTLKTEGVNKEYVIEKYLKECYKSNYTKCDSELIIELLKQLFPDDVPNMGRKIKPNSISNDKNFYKYFSHRVFFGEISISEFKKVQQLTLAEYEKQIDKWIAQNLIDEVTNKLNLVKMGDLTNREDFEKHLKILFYFGEKTARENGGYFVDTKYLFNFLYHEENSQGVVSNWYDGNYNEYISFVKSLFLNSMPPHRFTSWFISVINSNFGEQFILPIDFLREQNLRYFKEYFELNKNLERPLWNYYYNNKIRQNVNERDDGTGHEIRSVINPEVNKALLEGIKNYDLIFPFLYLLIYRSPFNNELFRLNDEVIKNIFGSNKNLEIYFNNLSEEKKKDKRIKEIIDFYYFIKDSGKSEIPYSFIHLNYPPR